MFSRFLNSKRQIARLKTPTIGRRNAINPGGSVASRRFDRSSEFCVDNVCIQTAVGTEFWLLSDTALQRPFAVHKFDVDTGDTRWSHAAGAHCRVDCYLVLLARQADKPANR